MTRVEPMIRVRAATPADRPAMLTVAGALPEWFNRTGLAQMEQDFALHQGLVAVSGEAGGLGGAGDPAVGCPGGAGDPAVGFPGGAGDRVVGFATWIAPSPYTPDEPGAAEMTWLGVAPDWRGRAVGRRLVAALEAACRAAGVHTVHVSTLADSVDYPPYAETRAFYRALGYADWRVDPDHYGPGDDRLLLRKALAPQG